MSPFIIYAIVLNIAYILYYATIITMDMHAKPQGTENQTETISMDNDQESQETAIMPKTVTEDPFTGNFNIAEATELVCPAEEAPEDATSDNQEGQTEGDEDEQSDGGGSDDDGGEVAPAIDPSAEEGAESEQASTSEAQQGIEEAGQEETGQTEPRCHTSSNAHKGEDQHDLHFLPAAHFKMMVDRCHFKQPLAVGQLEIAHLQNNGQCFYNIH